MDQQWNTMRLLKLISSRLKTINRYNGQLVILTAFFDFDQTAGSFISPSWDVERGQLSYYTQIFGAAVQLRTLMDSLVEILGAILARRYPTGGATSVLAKAPAQDSVS